MGHGYTGKILRINLSTGACSVEEPGADFYRIYLGGWGFIAYYLLHEVHPGTDPLGPDNKLIFAPGVVTGTALAGSGRHAIGAKSPLTGGFGAAETGGFWGAELKRAGFDGIVVEGAADKPTYLWIHDDKVELRDAGHLWGRETKEVQERIWEELGDDRIRITQIGPAGENVVRYACIANELRDMAGRCGLGAVMGSKKLKAIAVRGTGRVSVADMKTINPVNQWLRENYKDLVWNLVKIGTGAYMRPMSDHGALPTLNSRYGSFSQVDEISSTTLMKTYGVGMEGCYACPIRCKKVIRMEGQYEVDGDYGGPEYESLAGLGSYCGVSDLPALAKANERCNAYTLDTISTGNSIAFTMECFERGILTESDTDGLDLTWGNAEALLALIEKIAHREGFGDFVAEGVEHMAKQLGPETFAFANHVKGQEIPFQEPRLNHALGLGFALSPTGADHQHSLMDSAFTVDPGSMKDLGILEPLAITDLGPEKVRLAVYYVDQMVLYNCIGLCHFFPYSISQVVEAVNGVTGWNTTTWELLKGAERVLSMARAYNLLEGFTATDDALPDRLYTAYPEGPCAGAPLDRVALDRAKSIYYEMMGWDGETGLPREMRLHELNVGWVSDKLKQLERR